MSSFTLAHTLTLALASLEIINISSYIIEPLIAISIAFVAIENLFFKYRHRRQIFIVFMFGLLHGLGFATMLKSFINDSFISSLIGFNLGVEFAQIFIVTLIVLTLLLIQKNLFINRHCYQNIIFAQIRNFFKLSLIFTKASFKQNLNLVKFITLFITPIYTKVLKK